jgi:catechol 2,3-dioxygenase-like lactoylglutathione lyase family enzyme
MTSAFTVTLDCNSPEALAAFWTEALHYRLVHRGPKVFCLGPPEGVAGVLLCLQEVAERKQGKNRMHIDIPSSDPDTDRARLLRLGAVALQRHTEAGYRWVVLADPEGNEFCLVHAGAMPPT